MSGQRAEWCFIAAFALLITYVVVQALWIEYVSRREQRAPKYQGRHGRVPYQPRHYPKDYS